MLAVCFNTEQAGEHNNHTSLVQLLFVSIHKSFAPICRPICGVASIQPVLGIHASLPQNTSAHLPPLPPQTAMAILPNSTVPMGEGSPPQAHLPNHGPQQSQPSLEQNGILDWLRKLRLHKYYPVFKQLTMEEVCNTKS